MVKRFPFACLESGVPPGGLAVRSAWDLGNSHSKAGRQDAAPHGARDPRRYTKTRTRDDRTTEGIVEM
jgi:hypothetical protein